MFRLDKGKQIPNIFSKKHLENIPAQIVEPYQLHHLNMWNS